MASLGLITEVLGFDETGTALMLTIFALQDRFGTACNETGDGALTLILTGFAEKHGIKKQTQTVELQNGKKRAGHSDLPDFYLNRHAYERNCKWRSVDYLIKCWS